MKSANLLMTMFMCVLLIPVLLFAIGCSQEENAQGVAGEAVVGEAADNAAAEEGEHAAGESTELASNEEREHAGGEESERGSGEEREGREGEGEHERGERSEDSREGEGEHGGESDENHGEEGEESGTRYTIEDKVVEIRRGVELTIKYDKATSTFIGTVKNVSNDTARRTRVEVHLSNGVELGPTTPIDLAPGQQADVKLSAEDQTFTWWSTHAEVGGLE